MKILTFTTLYPNNVWPNNGIFVQERVANFAKLNGCEVKVIAPIPYFPSIKLSWRWKYTEVTRKEAREGLEVYHPRYFMTPKLGMAFYGLKMFLSVLPTVKKVQENFNFDIIDTHYVYPDGFAGILLGRVFKKPVVVSARGSDIHLYSRLPIIRRLLQYTLHKADKVIAVCEALQEGIVRLGISGEKIVVIPNGVDPAKFYPIRKEVAKEALGLPPKQVILSVGHLTPNKGFDLLIKAMKILYTELDEKNLYLVIVGEGKYRRELERIISVLNLDQQVRLAGDIPHHELYRWYGAADLFCLASRQEGWPNVLLESLSCGTPVVATPVGGIPEIISSDKVGLLTERSEETIAKTISSALKRPWEPEALAQYTKEHTWSRVADSVSNVFAAALNGK